MKIPRLKTLLASLAVLVPITALHAIDITVPAVVDTFTAPPWPTVSGDPATDVTADWTTLAVGGGTDATITDDAGFDAKIMAAAEADATLIITALGSSSTIAPSNSGVARFNTGVNAAGTTFLQTRPTGVDYILLLARLTNATGADLNTLQVNYDYSKATDTAGETIKGLRAFWSTTGAAGSWMPIASLSLDPGAAATYAAPMPVSATIPLGAPLAAGGTMFLLWADQNSTGTDASYHIDNFAVTVGGPPKCFITGSVSNIQRSTGANPADASDDTVTFTALVTGTGPLSVSGWTVASPAGLTGNSGIYGTPQTISNVPISNFTNGNLQLVIQDADALATCQTTISVNTATVIGLNEVTGSPILTSGEAVNYWVFDEAQRTSTQNSAVAGDNAVTTQSIDLSTAGDVLLRADLDARAGTTSGFELGDGFGMEIIIDGAAPISVLGTADIDANGRLNGAAAAVGPELPDATVTGFTQTFSFYAPIPAAANNVQIRFIGNSNSPNETFVVKNLRLSNAAPFVFVSSGGRPVLDNKNTASAADDEFSGLIRVEAVGFAGTNWVSNEAPARTGAYAASPALFGPYLVTGGPKTVVLNDQTTPAIVSAPITIPVPPAADLNATAPANISNNPDGSVTFQSTVTSANAGPGFTVTGATASSSTYGPGVITFTIPAPLPATPATVILTDFSYPGANQTLTVALPVLYTIGQTNLGGGLQDLFSATSDALWVNDAALRTLTMNAGVAADSVVTSQVINLTSVGAVNFSAKFNIDDTSAGSNLEAGDRFKAELVIDEGLPTETIINLVDAWDVGNGDNSTAIATNGVNGAKNGYINGYTGTAGLDLVSNITYATGAEEYNANKNRDEFNTDAEDADVNINNDFLLSYPIPAAANTVRLRIYGAGISGSEIATVSDVLFSTGPVVADSDGDGVSDADEAVMGTSPTDASDVLRISRDPVNPYLFSFPSKTGRFYKVYSSPDLLTWTPTTLASIQGDGTTKTFDITGLVGTGRMFFRLNVMSVDGPWN